MILNIRGCSGSGKTWLVRRIMEEIGPPEPILNENGKVEGYLLRGDIRIVGSYENKCGGCDAVDFNKATKALLKRWPSSDGELTTDLSNLGVSETDIQHIKEKLEKGKEPSGKVPLSEARVRRYAALGNVIFEGLVLSGVYGRFLQVSRDLGGIIWALLDTPVSTCEARILDRNGGRPIKIEHLERIEYACRQHYKRATEDGERAIWVDHTRAFEQVMEIIYAEVPELSPPAPAPVVAPRNLPIMDISSLAPL